VSVNYERFDFACNQISSTTATSPSLPTYPNSSSGLSSLKCTMPVTSSTAAKIFP
jgi:hypothetical protein